jgi:hypothetical protein
MSAKPIFQFFITDLDILVQFQVTLVTDLLLDTNAGNHDIFFNRVHDT